MSKKRDKHLLANETDEIKYHIQQETEKQHARNAIGVGWEWLRYRLGLDDSTGDKESGCLWKVIRDFVLAPLVLIGFISLLKSCGL